MSVRKLFSFSSFFTYQLVLALLICNVSYAKPKKAKKVKSLPAFSTSDRSFVVEAGKKYSLGLSKKTWKASIRPSKGKVASKNTLYYQANDLNKLNFGNQRAINDRFKVFNKTANTEIQYEVQIVSTNVGSLRCGDSICSPALGENSYNCSDDCGEPAFCGDGICSPTRGENVNNCSADCGPKVICGDGVCSYASGENSNTCARDCGAPTPTPTPTHTPTPTPTATPTPSPTPFPEFGGDCNSLSPYRTMLTVPEAQYFLDKVALGIKIPEEFLTNGDNSRINLNILINYLLNYTLPFDDAPFFNAMNIPEDTPENISSIRPISENYLHKHLLEGRPLHGYYTIFLMNHFATNVTFKGMQQHLLNIMNHPIVTNTNYDSDGVRYEAEYAGNDTLRLQNFRNQTLAMVFDPITGPFLNLQANINNRYNQNFPRELLEIFTTGTFDPVTLRESYDEDDIQEITRSMTGVRVKDLPLSDTYLSKHRVSYFNNANWDSGSKVLFHDLGGNKVANFNYKSAIDRIFDEHPSTAPTIAAQLFGHFVRPTINRTFIRALGNEFKSSNYNTQAFLTKVFKSESMFCRSDIDSSLSIPAWYYISVIRKLNLPYIDDKINAQLRNQLYNNENRLYDPKSGVFGSDFYPGVNRVRGENNQGQKGITESRLYFRLKGLDYIFWSIDNSYPLTAFDWLSFIPGYKDGQNPSDTAVINSIAKYFNVTLNRKEFDNLKLFLNTAPGTTQPDGTVPPAGPRAFSQLLSNSRAPGNTGINATRELRGIIRESIKLILTTPGYILL